VPQLSAPARIPACSVPDDVPVPVAATLTELVSVDVKTLQLIPLQLVCMELAKLFPLRAAVAVADDFFPVAVSVAASVDPFVPGR
jgi:hypothetical protein